jgi:hypothetical protein
MDTIKIIEESATGSNIGSMSPLIREEYFLNLAKINHLGFALASTLDKLYEANDADMVLRELPKMKELSLRKIVQLSSIIGVEVTVHIDMNKTPSPNSIKIRFDRPVRVARLRKFNIEAADTELIVSSITMKRLNTYLVYDISTTMNIPDALVHIYRAHNEIIDTCNSADIITKIDKLLQMMINLITFKWSAVINTAREIKPSGNIIDQATSSEFDWLYTSLYDPIMTQSKYIDKNNVDPILTTDKDLIESIATSTGSKFSSPYYDATIQHLSGLQLSKIYYDVKYGRSKDITDTVAEYKTMLAQAKHRYIVKEKMMKELNLAQVYLRIIEQRLPKKYQQVSKLVSPRVILDALTEPERKIVLIEHEQRLKYIESQINNKCEHIITLKKFKRANSDSALYNSFNELSKYFNLGRSKDLTSGGDDINDGFIHCNICKFPLICEHVKIFTELTISHSNYAEIKAALSPYIASSHEFGTDPHCKICGSVISTDLLGSVEIPEFTMNDELKKFIYGEIMGLIRYISFAVLINVPQTVSIIRDACYPYVSDLEKKIIKSKTASADEVKSKLRLYTSIYIVAYLVHLSIKNPNTITFKGFTNKEKNPVVGLIKRSIEIILESKNTILRFIPNTNADVIKNSIISAYKTITTVKVAVEGDITHIPIDYDPIYKYVEMITNAKSLKKPKSCDDVIQYIDPVELLHIDTGKKKKDTEPVSIFANVRYSDAGKEPKLLSVWSSPSEWASIRSWVSARSYECLMRYIHTGIYREPVYIDTGGDGKSELHINMDLVSWYDTTKSLINADNLARASSLLISGQHFVRPDRLNDRLYKYIDVPLGRIYDTEGRTHRWDIFIVDGAEVSKKTIEHGSGKNADRKCSVCGVLQSESGSIDEKQILESLAMINIKDNFYRFYDTRCPEGGLHETDEGGKCNKCGYEHKPVPAYFKKYVKKYDIDRKLLHVVAIPEPIKELKSPDYSDEYGEWSLNFNSVLSIADTFKVNQRSLAALGATNGIDYDLILNGTHIPSEAESPDDTRIYTLHGHIIGFIREYNQMRNFGKTIKPNVAIAQFMDANAPKHLISNLSELLEPLDETFKSRFEWFRLNKKPRETVSWLLQWLCDTMNKIAGTGTKETAKLRHEFVAMYLAKLIANDMKVSKPKHFNWALIYGEKEEKSRDSNYTVEADEESDDEGEEPGAMSMDGFDMEDDTDPDGNQIRVGENYGLD